MVTASCKIGHARTNGVAAEAEGAKQAKVSFITGAVEGKREIQCVFGDDIGDNKLILTQTFITRRKVKPKGHQPVVIYEIRAVYLNVGPGVKFKFLFLIPDFVFGESTDCGEYETSALAKMNCK